MESWRQVWRTGIVQQVDSRSLAILWEALKKDDPRIIQGATTVPTPVLQMMDQPVESADVIAFIGWQCFGAAKVAEAEDFWFRVFRESNSKTNCPDSACYFLNWYDSCPRNEMRESLIAEITREIAIRLSAEPVITIDHVKGDSVV